MKRMSRKEIRLSLEYERTESVNRHVCFCVESGEELTGLETNWSGQSDIQMIVIRPGWGGGTTVHGGKF